VRPAEQKLAEGHETEPRPPPWSTLIGFDHELRVGEALRYVQRDAEAASGMRTEFSLLVDPAGMTQAPL